MSYKIKLTVGGAVVSATLNESLPSRELVAQLPLRLHLSDLLLREKFAHLPQPLSTQGQSIRTFEVGDLAYFAPASAVVIFYRQDGAVIETGLYLLGKLDQASESEVLRAPGEVEVLLELAA